jgi:hypothetical protein
LLCFFIPFRLHLLFQEAQKIAPGLSQFLQESPKLFPRLFPFIGGAALHHQAVQGSDSPKGVSLFLGHRILDRHTAGTRPAHPPRSQLPS